MSLLRIFLNDVAAKGPSAAKTQAEGDPATDAGKNSTPAPTPPDNKGTAKGAPPILTSLKIGPVPAAVATKGEYQLHAKGETAAGDKPDVTKSVTWSSADESIAKVDQNGLVTAGTTIKSVKITAKDKAGSAEDTIDFQVIKRVLTKFTLSQKLGSHPHLVGGGSVHFQAFGHFTDKSVTEVKEGIAWSVSDRKVLSIDSTTGLATSVGIGRAKIIVTDQASGVKGDVEVTVDPPGAGARKTKVQIILNNFDDHPILGGKGLAVFKSPGAADVALGGDIREGVLSFTSAFLMPEGTFHLSGWGMTEATPYTMGTAPYKLPGGDLITFTAAQKTLTQSTKAASPEEAARNVGATGKRYDDYEVEKLDKDQWQVKWPDNSWIIKQG